MPAFQRLTLQALEWVILFSILMQTPMFAQAPAPNTRASGMDVVGYADRLSVQQGETIRFMVSSKHPTYRVDIVRLIQGDINPTGPGFKEELVSAAVNKSYPGQSQELPNGSYVTVPDNPLLAQTGSFTLQAWIAPTKPTLTTPAGSFDVMRPTIAQGLLTKWSATESKGYGLVIDESGNLALWLGDPQGQTEIVSSGKPFRPWRPAVRWARGAQNVDTNTWYFVAATFDATTGRVVLYQEPLTDWPLDDSNVVAEHTVQTKTLGTTNAPFLMGAYWAWREATEADATGHYNGKLENPRLFDRALTKEEIQNLKRGTVPSGAVATWDFSLDISSRRVSDTSGNDLHGQTVQMPTRAVTGHNWKEQEMNWNNATEQYGAIYFHDDDLDDAQWKVGFEYPVPADLKSSIYAARLRAGNGEDYVPFFVRPKNGTATAKIAFLVPTFSYMAYANSGGFRDPQLLSLYHRHSDGSGVTYSSRLRPILNMRPKLVTRNPWQFMADTHLTDWLEAKEFQYDVITDEDLHWEGASLLEPYNVIITGTHPEYDSDEMLDGFESYLNSGGRLMYMGGNGFYWITSLDPEGRHTLEVRRRHGTNAWEAAAGEDYHSTTGEFGGLWRFRGRPPQELVGVGFAAQGFDVNSPYRRAPGSFDPRASWIFDGVGPEEEIGNFPSLVLEFGAAGSELDRVDLALGTPAHTLILATSYGHSDAYQHVVEEIMMSDSLQGGTVNESVKADMTLLEYPEGGAVWSSSSIAWCGSLYYNDYDNNVSRITENVLRRFASDEPLPGHKLAN